MTRWLKSLFAWREVFRTGVWVCEENRVTGKRRVWRWNISGHSPKPTGWLKGDS